MPSLSVVAARPPGAPFGPLAERSHRRLKLVRSRAPLRLGLAGGGTDVSPFCERFGGLVVNSTIDQYCYTTLAERDHKQVVFVTADRNMSARLGQDEDSLPLHTVIYKRLCGTFALGNPSLTITTAAEAPPGSGLGSSSTLVVSAIEAFREYFSLPLGEYDIASLAHSIERNDGGLSGGRQDQYAATFGGCNSMEFKQTGDVLVNPLRLNPAIIQELEASLALFYTGVERASANIIDKQTQHIRGQHIDRIAATLRLKDEAASMKEALLLGDLQRVATVLSAGWAAKRQLAKGIATPRIDALFDLALANGALAGKVSGAGGGGYILFLCEPHLRPHLIATLSTTEGRVDTAHFVEHGATAWRLN